MIKQLMNIRFWVLIAALSLAFQVLFPPESYQHLLDAIKMPASTAVDDTDRPGTHRDTTPQVISQTASVQS